MHYIYHIPGIKIGCAIDPKYRTHKQGFTEYEILEQYECGWHAGNREQILQAEYGYRVDTVHYMQTRQFGKKGQDATRGTKGKSLTEEAKAKISAANKGKTHTEESKAKISIAQKGKTHTEEAKAKMSAALKGIPKPKFECPHCGKIIGGAGSLILHVKNKHNI